MEKTVRRYLDGEWSLSFTLPDEDRIYTTMATVPGNAEPVLVREGLIDDYMPADNEFATEKFQYVDDWCYTTSFDADLTKNCMRHLVFEGIDTIADIYLNGEHICECMNMHLAYRIDVTKKLKEKDNSLKVIIHSSELWAREHCHDNFIVANENVSVFDSMVYLRKTRHQWGWDNAPRLLTSGIIRSVYIEELPERRLEDVYVYTQYVNDTEVCIGAGWQYRTDRKSLRNHKIRLSVMDNDTVIYTETRQMLFVQGLFRCFIPRDNVRLWWPSGFGEPYMYTLRLEILENDEVCAEYSTDFGIRTLVLERTEDILDDGTGEFVFRINGERVFVRGANWKPLHPLASIADRKTCEGKALRLLTDMHCNMVRIWGGGIYEDEAFFEYCDKNGIMVWQDFMFACELPPADGWFCDLVAKEAEYIIKKYRNHPSLAIWCGDNENDISITWRQCGSAVRPSHNVISRKVLKDAVLHFDPFRSYVESSPYLSDTHYEQLGAKVTHHPPEVHLYPPVCSFSEALRAQKSLFIGETGPIIVNSVAVNDRCFEREKHRMERLWDKQPLYGSILHQHDDYFTAWRQGGKEVCEHFYGRDFSLDQWKDYTLAVNVICAEVFKDVIEYSRISRWNKTGVIWWSLIDMWPMAFNYSVVDCDFNKKLAYHWITKSQQEFALMAVREKTDGDLALYAVNDTLVSHTAEYTVTAYDKACSKAVIANGSCAQDANSSGIIADLKLPAEPQLLIIRWSDGRGEYVNHAFTGKAEYEVMKNWIKIIADEFSLGDELLELS